jgi:ubiquinone/menaquinone biosynthesis C-methylase UbiE
MYVNRYIRTIKLSEKVIDLGSGNNPNPRANVCVDFSVSDNTHREGAKLILPSTGKFIEWDLNKYPLPFKDKEFDFVICSHIVEHLQNPKRFCEEIQRIGKRGYIETPNKLYEQIYGWPFHRWYVYIVGEDLIFENKSSYDFLAPLGRKLYKRSREFYEGHHRNIEQLLTSFYWEDSFNVRVIDNNDKYRKEWNYIKKEDLDWSAVHVPIKYPFIVKKFLNLFK